MAFLRIAGVYRVTGTEPDGDSIRFVPDDPTQWARVAGMNRVRVNSSGGAQLRLDAIDALETHYTPLAGSRLHQPRATSCSRGWGFAASCGPGRRSRRWPRTRCPASS